MSSIPRIMRVLGWVVFADVDGLTLVMLLIV